jgi:hypothetical protein
VEPRPTRKSVFSNDGNQAMRRLWTAFRWTARRAPLILSTLLATTLLVIGVWSIFSPVYFEWSINPGNVLYTYSSEGLVRLVWFQCKEPIKVTRSYLATPSGIPGTRIEISLADGNTGSTTLLHGAPTTLRAQFGNWPSAFFQLTWRRLMIISSPSRGLSVPVYNSLARAPSWIVVPLLYAYPLLVVFGKPARGRRRRQRGLCVKCAYDLTGNVSGKCPECGTSVTKNNDKRES